MRGRSEGKGMEDEGKGIEDEGRNGGERNRG